MEPIARSGASIPAREAASPSEVEPIGSVPTRALEPRSEAEAAPIASAAPPVEAPARGVPSEVEPITQPASAPSREPAPVFPSSAKPGGEPSARTTVRIPARSLDRFLDTVGELMVQRGRLATLLAGKTERAIDLSLQRLKGLVDRVYSDVMALRLLPFGSIADRFIRSVRELADAQQKRVELKITGREVLLDRSMLDELADPINHLLRNAVDHGIELPAERTACGKPECGTITIALVRSGDSVTIRIADDGRGMDPGLIKQSALDKGFLTREAFATIADADALMLTTIPGFYTAHTVTEISGRGVGMDVVRTRVETLGGRLALRSGTGAGLAVEMRLPLTIVVVQAFLLEAGGVTWAVPLSAVSRTINVRPEHVDRSDGQDFVAIGDDWVPLLDLARTLKLPGEDMPFSRMRPALLASDRDRSVAYTVDRVVGRREIVVKPLGVPLEELRGYAGATILDDGRIALILDLLSLASL